MQIRIYSISKGFNLKRTDSLPLTTIGFLSFMTLYSYMDFFAPMQYALHSPSIHTKPEPNMLKVLAIIPSSTSQKTYPLFLFYSHVITYYSNIILVH